MGFDFFSYHKKEIGIALAALAVIAIGIFVVLGTNEPPTQSLGVPGSDPNADYSIDPTTWIEEGNDTVSIDVVKATGGRGEHVFSQERYIQPDGDIIALHLEGNYQGMPFKRIYVGSDNQTRMRIYPEMDPYDGVIDAFALFKKEDGRWVFYLFVDHDWKELSGENLNILWGSNIRDYENVHEAKFDFSWEDEGIYYTRITEDIDWFYNQNPITGRLFFGELTMDDLKARDFGKTFVILV